MRKKDLKGEVNLVQLPGHMKYIKELNKTRFPYFGVYCFCGRQGSGKTLSAVRLINNIYQDYKDVYLVTNVDVNTDVLKNIPKENVIKFERFYQIFFTYNKPVIFFIDEAHILFNSLHSRDTDLNLFQVISQNRKQQRIFILTSQVFNRLEKFMKEQIHTVITCDTYFHFLTHCVVYTDFEKDRDELVGKKSFGAFYTHNKNVHYNMYDTYQVISFDRESPFWTPRKVDENEGFFEKYKHFLKEDNS